MLLLTSRMREACYCTEMIPDEPTASFVAKVIADCKKWLQLAS